MLAACVTLAAAAFSFSPAALPSTSAQVRASSPVMSEMTSRRAALLGFGAFIAAAPLSANAVEAVPIWKTSKKALGAKNKPPTGAAKCSVGKPCVTGAGIKWDPVALGVSKGSYDQGNQKKCTNKECNAQGENTPRKFFKTPTYASSPI